MSKESSKPAICPACHTPYTTIYYQRRAADEPPDKVVYCEKCPLDITRLSFAIGSELTAPNNKRLSNIGKEVSTSAQKSLSSLLSKSETKTFIVVKGNAALKCYRYIASRNVESTPTAVVPVNINNGTKVIKSFYYLNGSTENTSQIITNSNIVAPFIVRREADIYTSKVPIHEHIREEDKYIASYEYILPNIQHCSSVVLRTLHDGQKPYILLSLEKTSESVILDIIDCILVEYGTETTIKSILTNTIWNALYTHSSKAFDWPSAPNTGYTFTWKPDGERYWYIKYASLWLFCKPRLSGKIEGWNISSRLTNFVDIGPVLDVEVMISFPPILIDILVSSSGQIMPISRTLTSVLDEFKYISESGVIDIPIYLREYYRSDKELLATKSKLEYPIDGVVGIQDGSMNIIKLKDEKSIELELQENGDLTTSDKYIIANSNLQEQEEVGSIVEIRFVKESTSDVPNITETFVRTDKIKANDLQACKKIVSAMSDTPDTLARRNALEWCNSVRSKLNQVASKLTGKGRVILDIGAGDGQAVSDYSTDPEVTYLLLEPDIKKCYSMQRRLQDLDRSNTKLFKSPTDVINALRLLITGKIKYGVLCATLKQILDQKDCVRTLKSCVRCCIASLSISYIAPELQELAIEGLNVIGFGYMYDSANNKGELVKEHGVVMKYTSYQSNEHSDDAMVMWGTDKVYIEPAITLKDFNEVFYCKLAKNTVPIVRDSLTSLLNTISTRVYIISSARYII